MAYTGREPVVTIWRNRIPHRATLMYWGTKWMRGTHGSPLQRILSTRPRHRWTIHSPVLGAETMTIDCRGTTARWHNFRVYDQDGHQLTIAPMQETSHEELQ